MESSCIISYKVTENKISSIKIKTFYTIFCKRLTVEGSFYAYNLNENENERNQISSAWRNINGWRSQERKTEIPKHDRYKVYLPFGKVMLL